MSNLLLHLLINIVCSGANPNTSLHKTKDSSPNNLPLKIPHNGVYHKVHPISTSQNTAITSPTTNVSFVNRCFGQIVKLCRPTILGRTQPSVPEIQPVKVETVPHKPNYRLIKLAHFASKILVMKRASTFLKNHIPRGIKYEPLEITDAPIKSVTDLTTTETLVARDTRRDARYKNKKYLLPGGYTGLNYCTRYMYTKLIDNAKQNDNVEDEVDD